MLMKELHRRYHKEQPRTAGCRMVSLITLASDSSGVLGKEIVPLTKDQFMRGWPVAFKQQWKVLSRNPSWFPKVLMRKDLKFTWNIPKMCCAHANEQEPLDWTLVWRVSNVFQSMLPKSDFPWREPPFFFLSGICEHLLCVFCTNDDLVVTGMIWLSILHGYIYLYYDSMTHVYSLFVEMAQENFKFQVFCFKIRCSRPFDFWTSLIDAWVHVFFSDWFWAGHWHCLYVPWHPWFRFWVMKVPHFLWHSFVGLRFSFTNVWILPCSHVGQVFCSPFPMAQSHMVDASSLGPSFKGKCSTSTTSHNGIKPPFGFHCDWEKIFIAHQAFLEMKANLKIRDWPFQLQKDFLWWIFFIDEPTSILLDSFPQNRLLFKLSPADFGLWKNHWIQTCSARER